MNSYFLFIHHVNSYIPVNPHHTDYFTNGIVYSSVNNLLCLTSDLNSWTSNFVMTHGDQSIDVSSAAQRALSSSPSGIYPHQIIQYPCKKYYVDFFFGIDAKDLLIKMLKSPNCIDGCKVVSMPPKKTKVISGRVHGLSYAHTGL